MDINKHQRRSFEAIGLRLKTLRLAHDLTQAEFAKSLGIAQSAYSQYENAKKRPSLENARAICDIYNLTLDWLYDGNTAGLPLQLVKLLNPQQEAS